MGGPTTDIVMLEDFLAKLMVRSSEAPGLASLIESVVGFSGAEFYIKDLPEEMLNTTFAHATHSYISAVLVGIMHPNGSVELCPAQDRELTEGDMLVMLADDEAATEALHAFPPTKVIREPLEGNFEEQRISKVETILVFGWNGMTVRMLLELDDVVSKGTRVLTFGPKDVEEQEKLLTRGQRRWQRQFVNITEITHVQGNCGSRYQLEELPIKLEEATKVFIVSDDEATDVRLCDATALTTVMQIRDILAGTGIPREVAIVPEIRDPQSGRQFCNNKIFGFVDSSGLPAQIIGMIAFDPRIARVVSQLISDDSGVELAIRSLQDYCKDGDEEDALPSEISFYDVISYTARRGDVAIGWSMLPENSREHKMVQAEGNKGDFHREMKAHLHAVHAGVAYDNVEWDLNPVKEEMRPWCARTDRIVVICHVSVAEESMHRAKSLHAQFQAREDSCPVVIHKPKVARMSQPNLEREGSSNAGSRRKISGLDTPP